MLKKLLPVLSLSLVLVVPVCSAQSPDQSPLAKMIQATLPFSTSASPGRFATYSLSNRYDQFKPMLSGRTFCVLGADPLSLRWLSLRKELLVKHHAICYLANIQTLAEIDKIRQAAHPLNVNLVNADVFLNSLDIKQYPVIVHQGWVAQ
ncbi:DUF2859 domain-containing protein [Thiomicrorhabdus indica]|uniref:DUF2859 domain-containing protein n=1 Tax=Thiomicrorhabdus indica TaxID=2267253 RepID=UPI0013EEA76F|nr:DUF2859 domain-containing protein [Thiomicrorhabdus indica]